MEFVSLINLLGIEALIYLHQGSILKHKFMKIKIHFEEVRSDEANINDIGNYSSTINYDSIDML